MPVLTLVSQSKIPSNFPMSNPSKIMHTHTHTHTTHTVYCCNVLRCSSGFPFPRFYILCSWMASSQVGIMYAGYPCGDVSSVRLRPRTSLVCGCAHTHCAQALRLRAHLWSVGTCRLRPQTVSTHPRATLVICRIHLPAYTAWHFRLPLPDTTTCYHLTHPAL